MTGAADPPSSWDALVAAVATEAAAQHARFDAAVFHTVMGLSGAQLAAAIAGSDGAPALLRSYARLVAEAIGTGLLDLARIDAQTGGDGPRDLLAWGLVRAAPTLLPKCDPARRPHHLAALWNHGEGILREPPWLNTYASTFVPAVTDLDALPAYLTALLDPVVRARPTARWKGPFTAAVADPRALLDAFLPGTLHLAAPSVVCLHDRRDVTHLALLFAAGTPARLFGPVPCLGHDHRDASAPPASIGLQRPHRRRSPRRPRTPPRPAHLRRLLRRLRGGHRRRLAAPLDRREPVSSLPPTASVEDIARAAWPRALARW